MNRRLILTLSVVALLLPSASIAAVKLPSVPIQILHTDGKTSSISIASANAASGASLAVADLGTDGTPEIILGAGLGNAPEVIVLREDGTQIGRFLAYAPTSGMGVNVAVCDLDGNGVNEIITSPQKGGGPHVRIFDRMGKPADGGGFFAYDSSTRYGLAVSCGDLTGDGKAEIVTMSAPGGTSLVKVWQFTAGKISLLKEWFAFPETDMRGLVGVIHNGILTVASSRGNEGEMISYTLSPSLELVTGAHTPITTTGGGTVSLAFTHGTVRPIAAAQTLHLASTVGDIAGVNVVEADLDTDGNVEVISVPARPSFNDRETADKSIIVDISEQRLYAYERGLLANTFFVSTGKTPFVTPLGSHKVLAKVPFVHYAGIGWDLGTIPWNLRIYPHIYIHYAPWHNNFGATMSHGCVNVNLTNIKWVYDWATVGIPVTVQT